MNCEYPSIKLVFIFLLVIFSTVKSYPFKGDYLNNKVHYKNEEQYPNGTVVGKYTYKDKEGNPVHVKYFADDSSYGVELKSAKAFDLNSDSLIHYTLPKFNNMMSTVDIFQPLEGMNTVNAILNKEFNNKNKTDNAYEVPNYYPNKINNYKEYNKANDDYEIFLENDLKHTAKYNKEKVKVYLDKNKRKTRNAPYHYEPSDYCERF